MRAMSEIPDHVSYMQSMQSSELSCAELPCTTFVANSFLNGKRGAKHKHLLSLHLLDFVWSR